MNYKRPWIVQVSVTIGNMNCVAFVLYSKASPGGIVRLRNGLQTGHLF